MSTEEQLGHTLRQQAEGIDDQPLTLGDVRRRARQIRRRQASGVAAGVALIAAVALPIALLGGTGADKSEPSPAPSPTRAVDPYEEGVPTLQDSVIVYPDGPRIPLDLEDGQSAEAFAPLGSDQWVVVVGDDSGERASVVVDETGQQLASYPSSGSLVTSHDARAVGWIGTDGTPMLVVTGQDEPEVLSKVDGTDPVPVAITGDCANTCAMWVQADGDGELGHSYRISTDGTVTDAPLPAVVGVSPDEDLIAGLDRIDDDEVHVCGGLYDVRIDDYRWESCEYNVYLFSPGGGLVATQFGEGLGPNQVSLVDASSSTPVAAVTGSWIPSIAWEDATHLLAVVVADNGQVTVERIGIEGTETVLEGFTMVDEFSLPVILPVTG